VAAEQQRSAFASTPCARPIDPSTELGANRNAPIGFASCRAGVFFRNSIYARRIAAFATGRRKAGAEAWSCAGAGVCRNGRDGAEPRSSTTGSRSDSNTDTNSHSDAHTDTNPDSHTNADTHTYSNAHTYSNPNADAYADTCSNPNADAHTDAYADPCSNSNTDAYPNAYARSDACPAEPVPNRH
jgi:hypothetical protein